MNLQTQYLANVPHGLMFHHFRGNGHPAGQGAISADEFDAIITFVGRDRLLAPEEWFRRLRRGKFSPSDLCITFDDSLLCQFDVALPVLEHHGLKAFWFVYSGVFEGRTIRLEVYRAFRSMFKDIDEFYDTFFARVRESEHAAAAAAVPETEIAAFRAANPLYSARDARYQILRDRVLTRDQFEALMDRMLADNDASPHALAGMLWMRDEHLRRLAEAGHEIGLHSYSHPTRLADLSAEQQREEYTRNYEHVSAACGRAPRSMSHPSNSYDLNTLRILEELGIECGFRANMRPAARGARVNRSPLELAREDHMHVLEMQRAGAINL